MAATIDGYTAGDLRNLFASSPASFFKAYAGGPTNESGPDLDYFEKERYRDAAAEARGAVLPLEFFIYADAKQRGFNPFGQYEGDWAFRQRVVRSYWDQPGFGGANAGRRTGLEVTVDNEARGLAEYRDQQRPKSRGLGDLGALAALAGIVTGGLSLAGSLASAATAAAGSAVAEVAGLAALDAGFVGAAGASAISGAGIGAASTVAGTLGAATNLARSGYSVASGVQRLTSSPASSTIATAPRATNMANPLYLVRNVDTAASQQSAPPAQIGQTPPPAGGALPFGLTGNALALLAVAAVAYYAFKPEKG